MAMLKKAFGLLTDAATYGASSMLGQVISFLLLPLYTKYLTPSDYGVLALLAIFVSIVSAIVNLGMSNAIFRHFNVNTEKEERGKIIATGFWTTFFSSMTITALGLFLINDIVELLFSNGQPTEYILFVQISLFTCMANAIGQIPNVILRAERRVKMASLLNVAGLTFTILLTILFVVKYNWGVLGVVKAQFVGAFFTSIIRYIATLKIMSWKGSFSVWWQMITYGLPVVPHQLVSIALLQFNQYMIWDKLGPEQAGLFNIATKITMPLTFVIGAGQQAWVPYKFQIAATEKNPAHFFRTIATYYFAMIFFLWGGLSLWGFDIIRVMTTKDFHDAGSLISVVGLIPITQGIYWMLGSGYGLGKSQKSLPFISLAGLITVVSSSHFFVLHLGVYGAALSTASGMLVMAFCLYVAAQRQFAVNYNWPMIFTFIAMAVFCACISYFLQSFTAEVRILATILLTSLYPLLVLFLLKSTTEGRQHLKAIFTKISLVNCKKG